MAGREPSELQPPADRLRLDKWLFHARFAKTRAVAVEMISGRGVRVNGVKAAKPAQPVGPGDTLTFPQGGRIRVVRVLACGARRGPAAEAATLYLDLDPLVGDQSLPVPDSAPRG